MKGCIPRCTRPVMISSVVLFSFKLILDFPQKAAILFSDFCSLFCSWVISLDVEYVLMSSANCDSVLLVVVLGDLLHR